MELRKRKKVAEKKEACGEIHLSKVIFMQSSLRWSVGERWIKIPGMPKSKSLRLMYDVLRALCVCGIRGGRWVDGYSCGWRGRRKEGSNLFGQMSRQRYFQ
jgi:hypothetical protein